MGWALLGRDESGNGLKRDIHHPESFMWQSILSYEWFWVISFMQKNDFSSFITSIIELYSICFKIYESRWKKRLKCFEICVRYDLLVDVMKKDQSFFYERYNWSPPWINLNGPIPRYFKPPLGSSYGSSKGREVSLWHPTMLPGVQCPTPLHLLMSFMVVPTILPTHKLSINENLKSSLRIRHNIFQAN